MFCFQKGWFRRMRKVCRSTETRFDSFSCFSFLTCANPLGLNQHQRRWKTRYKLSKKLKNAFFRQLSLLFYCDLYCHPLVPLPHFLLLANSLVLFILACHMTPSENSSCCCSSIAACQITQGKNTCFLFDLVQQLDNAALLSSSGN